MSLIRLAWRNIVSKPLNLLLSIILFGLGIGLINFLLLTNDQLSEKFENNLAQIDMVLGAKGSPLQMILCNMYHIDNPTGNINIGEAKAFLNPKHPLIKTAIPLSLGDSYQTYRIVGTTYEILELYKGELGTGKLFEKSLEVTIGAAVANGANLKIGDTFASSHGFSHDEDLLHDESMLKVVGILKPTGSVLDQLILTSSKTVWDVHSHGAKEEGQALPLHMTQGSFEMTNEELLKHPEQDITSILVQFKNKTSIQALNMPRGINENTDLQAANPAYEINKLFALIGVGTNAIRWLAILIALVSAISIFITLYKSLRERKYELALLRVSGASPFQIFFLIIWEGIILGIIGYVVGILISHIGFWAFSNHAESSYRYAFDVFDFGMNELVLLGISIVIGMVAAVMPAISAWRTDIHETLSTK